MDELNTCDFVARCIAGEALQKANIALEEINNSAGGIIGRPATFDGFKCHVINGAQTITPIRGHAEEVNLE